MLIVDVLEHFTGETRNVDDNGGNIGESEADDVIVTAAFHLCDANRSPEAYCDAEVVDFMLGG